METMYSVVSAPQITAKLYIVESEGLGVVQKGHEYQELILRE
jgi:hypothetical protein